MNLSMKPPTMIVLAIAAFWLLSQRKANAAKAPLYGATPASQTPGARSYLVPSSAAAQFASLNGKVAGNTKSVPASQTNAILDMVNYTIRQLGGTVRSTNFAAASPNEAMSLADQYSQYGSGNSNALNVAQQYAQYGAGRVAGVAAALPDYMPSVADAYGTNPDAQALWAQEHADQNIIDPAIPNDGWGEG